MKVFYCENQNEDYEGIIIVAANDIDHAIKTAKNASICDWYFSIDFDEEEECFPKRYWRESCCSVNTSRPKVLFFMITFDGSCLDYKQKLRKLR